MLELHNARVTLSQREFRYSLKVAPCEIVVIVGPSGSGKSTLLNLVNGFLETTSGDVTWNGQSIKNMTPDERPVTTLFQKHNLFEHLSVWKNVALGFHPGARLDDGQKIRLREALDNVGLNGFESRMPGDLSGGEQQRVALARCLATHKPVLLLDEPYNALDRDLRKQMLNLTRKIVSAASLATILVTHDPDDAEALDARIVELVDGRLLEPVMD